MGRNDKGLVTFDHKMRKDAYYFYKAVWSDEPVLYITSRRDVNRKEPKTPVKVYANCTRVELKLNGVSQGTREAPDRVFLWESITLAPGTNRIETAGVRNGKTLADSCDWVLTPPQPKGDQPAGRPPAG